MSERPNPLVLAGTLRSLAECWTELDGELNRKGGPSSSSGASEFGAPLDLSVLDAKRAIETFARQHAHMLMDEADDWEPVNAHPPALLEALAMRIGHFTHHADAQVAFAFEDEVRELSESSWGVARPDGKALIPIGTCGMDGCAGKLRVLIDRDKPMDPESLRLWRPVARCNVDRGHVIDARIYAANTPVQVE